MTDAKPAGADAKFDAKALEIADKIAWEVGNAEVLEFARRLRTAWEKEQAQRVCNQCGATLLHNEGTARPAAAQPGMVSVLKLTDEEILRFWNGPTRESNKARIIDFALRIQEVTLTSAKEQQ